MLVRKRLWMTVALLLGCCNTVIGQAERGEQKSHETEEEFYEWSVWSPCSRSCGKGIQFRGQLCLRRDRDLCVEQPRKYQTCNTQPCLPGSASFRDVQCGVFNGRDIFVNGQRAKWMPYVRGDHQCLLFCYPYGGQLFYYFGKAKDGTPCSEEPNGVCVRGRCKPVGCDQKLESGVYLDKCLVCGGNSSTCEPIRGRIERLPSHFEKISGYAELLVIPKGSTSVLLSDATLNYLAVRRQNGEYAVNGHRIVNWSGRYKVAGVEVKYERFKDNIRETIEISGPTKEDIYVKSLLLTGRLNTTFEYWKPRKDTSVAQGAPAVKLSFQDSLSDSLMEWGRWTACSASCGGGIKVRARANSIVSSFRERETQVQRCNDVPCDTMMAEWSEWGQWDDCSASCGGGARIRFRYCRKPKSAVSRTACPGERYAVEQCNVHGCPVEATMQLPTEIATAETVDEVTNESSTYISTVSTKLTERCSPCENSMKRNTAYCTSDFVVHVKVLSEAISELSLDTKYRIWVIHSFKLSSALPALRSIWIMNNLCHCPLLIPGKNYLLMGQLTMRVGSTKTIAEISRDSYVEEWRGSMMRRIPELKKRCPLKTTQMPTVSTRTLGHPSDKEVPSTTQRTTTEIAKQPALCRYCRISKKRNRSYCESDFAIRATILTESFDNATQERKYLIKVIKVFKSVVKVKQRQEIFVANDHCRCPPFLLREQYVIMGMAKQISVSEVRLLIPPRPFVRIWNSKMEPRYRSLSDVCDN